MTALITRTSNKATAKKINRYAIEKEVSEEAIFIHEPKLLKMLLIVGYELTAEVDETQGLLPDELIILESAEAFQTGNELITPTPCCMEEYNKEKIIMPTKNMINESRLTK